MGCRDCQQTGFGLQSGRKRRFGLRIALLAVLILAALYLISTLAMFVIGFRRTKTKAGYTDESTGRAWEKYAGVIRAGADWFRAQPYETVELRSFDGLKLRAMLLEADQPRGVILSMHGYRSTPLRDLGASAQYYHDLGFTLLLPNQRACGDSEGRYITFGAREKIDVKMWCDYAAARYAGLPIVAAGISLGSSAVLMALDTGLPDAVKAAVADCGYSSLRDELGSVAQRAFHLKPRPILWGLNLWCRLLAGFDLYQCSTLPSMKNDKIPVLFIHGEADEFVPTRFSRENYEACAAPKELFTVPGADHGLSYLVDTPGYHRHLEAWFDCYCPGKDIDDESKNA